MPAPVKTVELHLYRLEDDTRAVLARLVLVDGVIEVVELAHNGAFVARELVLAEPFFIDGARLDASAGEPYLVELPRRLRGPFLSAGPVREMALEDARRVRP